MLGLLQHLCKVTIEMCLRPPLALTPPMVVLSHPCQVIRAQIQVEQVARNNLHLIRLIPDITATHCHHLRSHLTRAIVAVLLGSVAANLPRPLFHRSAVCLVTTHIARLHQHLRTALRRFKAQPPKVRDVRHILPSKCFPQPQPRTLIFFQA